MNSLDRIKKTLPPILYSFLVFIILFAIITFLSFVVVFCFNDFDFKISFHFIVFGIKKHIEFIAGLILAIIGIYFGVQAMQEASIAVKKSEIIIKTISSFFNDFSSMIPRVCELIDNANEELLIMVSLPAYGYLLNETLGEKFFNSFNKRITDASNDKPHIELICFRQDLCSEFENKQNLYVTDSFKLLSEEDKEKRIRTYFTHKNSILTGLFGIMNSCKVSQNDYCNLFTLMQDPYIRIFIADSKKAIFAITPSFNHENLSEFNIIGYCTEDKKMVEIIKNLFDKYKSQNPLSTSDFKSFIFETNEK